MATLRKSRRLETKETAAIHADAASDEESPEGQAGSSKKRSARTTTPSDHASEVPSDDEFDDVPAPSGPKRKRVGKNPRKALKAGSDQRPVKRHRGSRGLLERMTEMPMDLLFEIFGKLDPLDILHLSRTTKGLRAILMSRSSIAIWKECLENSGLPPCPDDLNEPQLVDLVFGKHCQVCVRAVNQHLVWDARIRLCSRCLEDGALFSSDDADRYNIPIKVQNCIPGTVIQTAGSGRRRRHVYAYHLPTINKWRLEYAQATDGDAWVQARLAEKDAREKHTTLFRRWQAGELSAKADKAASERNARIVQLISKLEEEGYSDNVEKWQQSSLLAEKEVQNLLKKELTDRVWGGAKAGILVIAARLREGRLEREHRATIKTRHELLVKIHEDFVKSQPIDALVIPPADLFKCAEVKGVYDAVPFDQDLTTDDFEEVIEQLPFMSERWVIESKIKLLEMAKPHLESAFAPNPIPEFALDLAVSASFESSYKQVGWKEALAACTKYRSYEDDPEARSFGKSTGEWPWNSKNSISFNARWFNHANAVLRALGHDPKSVTAQALDELDEVIECTSCTSFQAGRLMFDWRAATRHSIESLHTFVRVDPETAVIVKARMNEKEVEDRARYSTKHLVCVHCRRKDSGPAMRVHLAEKHDISPATDADVFVLPEVANRGCQIRYWKFEGATLL